MAKTSVENLKARFKRGMFPTEGDFANVFDSYVHKDDSIDINDVTAENGSKTLTTLLQEFKQEILQDAKDQETQYDDTELKGKVEANEGNISTLEGRVSTNEGNISTLKDDLDTAEDFIAGHESRIQALEERAEVPEGLAEFIEKVNSFLEYSDATDATINKWKEIEAFLTGITDTETLTGLLADLKEEILGEIPGQKEYTAGDGIDISEDGVISLKEDENKLDSVKVIADLDKSTAPKGTIAIYSGDTNDKYTHGFIYEKKGEGAKTIVIPVGTDTVEVLDGAGWMVKTDFFPSVGKIAYVLDETVVYWGKEFKTLIDPAGKRIRWSCSDNYNYVIEYNYSDSSPVCSPIQGTVIGFGKTTSEVVINTPSSTNTWTPLHVMNVIN